MIWPFSRPRFTVLMVCTANVCRSPAAEALLRHHLQKLGAGRSIAVRSAGTDVGAPGRRPDPRVLDILKEMGVNSRGMRAQALGDKLVMSSDLILVMESVHQQTLLDRFPEAESRTSLLDSSGLDIPDPYFGNKAGVRSMVEHVDSLARRLAEASPELLLESG
ncbi:low molecular weight phosphotyrosine protein phosphatase [Congregibacter brevis]|uniref:protein-tyrosine-phosphatase n=1 Tax=Congregibacter brevis TaxID=3081201 RepID=A0ABZ0IGI5_9GAMM|nr:low molecular weight phosphotyrosine protein phosphatase [Congregibacter sp. IMCC45268]